jgi:hypothetical protein
MFKFLVLLKFLLVSGMLIAGAFFIAASLGVEIALIKYKGLEVYGLPAGVVLLVAGLALARFWKVSNTEKTTTTDFMHSYTAQSGDAVSTTSQKQTEITTTFNPPKI